MPQNAPSQVPGAGLSQPVQSSNPYMQGNPFANMGINQPLNNATPPAEAAAVTAVASAVDNTAADKPSDVSDNAPAKSDDNEVTTGLFAAAQAPAEAASNGSDNAPAQMGPQADDRPAPSPMGEFKGQMPNTAPNPFLQNLENMKKDSEDNGNT